MADLVSVPRAEFEALIDQARYICESPSMPRRDDIDRLRRLGKAFHAAQRSTSIPTSAPPPATAAESVAQQIYALLADRFAEMIRFYITKHGLPESLASADVSAALRKTADDIAPPAAAGQGAAPGEPTEKAHVMRYEEFQ
jgi:hypothetical protein